MYHYSESDSFINIINCQLIFFILWLRFYLQTLDILFWFYFDLWKCLYVTVALLCLRESSFYSISTNVSFFLTTSSTLPWQHPNFNVSFFFCVLKDISFQCQSVLLSNEAIGVEWTSSTWSLWNPLSQTFFISNESRLNFKLNH